MTQDENFVASNGMTTNEMILAAATTTDARIANAPDSIETATKGKIKRAKKVAKEQAPEPEPFTMFVADSDVTSVSLADLVPLSDVLGADGLLAMREIDKQNLDHLYEALQAGDELPPIELVNTNKGMVPFDGYHRWAAYEKWLADTISEETSDGEKVVNGDTLLEARKQLFVPAHENTVTSVRELLQRAFEANLKHGLPASDASRGRFALWMYNEAKAEGNPISIREAARQAHVSHVAVLKLQSRIENAKRKMIDVMLSVDEQEELEEIVGKPEAETDSQKKGRQADKHMEAMVKAAKFFADSDITSTEMVRFAESYAAKTTKEAITEVISLLSYIRDAASHAPSPEQQELLKA